MGEKETRITSVSIPKPLFKKIKKLCEGTGFNSVSSFVTYVMRQVISESSGTDSDIPFSKEKEEEVKHRLKSLGYL